MLVILNDESQYINRVDISRKSKMTYEEKIGQITIGNKVDFHSEIIDSRLYCSPALPDKKIESLSR